MAFKGNSTDDKKIQDFAKVLSGEVKPETKEEKTVKTEEKKEVGCINISDPQPFIPTEYTTQMSSSELSQILNEVFSSIFVDYKDCNIYFNPQIQAIGCSIRFKYMLESEIKATDPDNELVVAVSTPANEIHETNEWANAIKRINAINSNGSKYAVLTSRAKEFLGDIVTKISRGNKIEWDKIVNSNIERIVDYVGQETQVITLDVSIDLSAILYKIFNGTETCPNFNKNKGFFYVPSFYAALGIGNDFVIQISKIDSKKRKEISDMIGYRCMTPSTWNTPVRM